MLRIASAALLVIVSAAPAAAAHVGERYDCHFRKAGHVVIDTREPGSSITVNGKKYLASGGSYFYYATERPEIAVMFGPNMKWWDYGVDGGQKTACRMTRNQV